MASRIITHSLQLGCTTIQQYSFWNILNSNYILFGFFLRLLHIILTPIGFQAYLLVERKRTRSIQKVFQWVDFLCMNWRAIKHFVLISSPDWDQMQNLSVLHHPVLATDIQRFRFTIGIIYLYLFTLACTIFHQWGVKPLRD